MPVSRNDPVAQHVRALPERLGIVYFNGLVIEPKRSQRHRRAVGPDQRQHQR